MSGSVKHSGRPNRKARLERQKTRTAKNKIKKIDKQIALTKSASHKKTLEEQKRKWVKG